MPLPVNTYERSRESTGHGTKTCQRYLDCQEAKKAKKAAKKLNLGLKCARIHLWMVQNSCHTCLPVYCRVVKSRLN